MRAVHRQRGRFSTAATSVEQFSQICQSAFEQSEADAWEGTALTAAVSSLQPEDVEQRLSALINVVGQPIVRAWMHANPSLLLKSTEELILQIQGIADMVGFPPEIVAILAAEHPQWVEVPMEQLQSNYQDLAELFSLSPVDMGRVIATAPSLLATPARTIRSNLYELSSALGVSSGTMLRAAPQFPTLMATTPEALQQRVEELAERLNMGQQEVRSMLGASPRLASLDADAVVGEWEGLRALLEGHSNWLSQLEALPPHLAAACLTSKQLKQRLLFFRETGLLETRYVNMSSILTQEDSDFASKYKGYVKWLREKVREQRLRESDAEEGAEDSEQEPSLSSQ